MKVGVVLASLGRAKELEDMVSDLRRQSLPPSVIILSLEKVEDAPPGLSKDIEVVLGPRGLCAQRNRGLAALAGRCDVVVFYDDDFVPSAHALRRISALFAAHPDIAGATGLVLADGVTTGGISREAARRIVDDYDAAPPASRPALVDRATAYGCNMAFRWSAIEGLWFDERLPLYGWQEDVDFGGLVLQRGRMVASHAFAGVHRGVTKGRMPGVRFGFSQIVNPIYLMRKGTMRRHHALSILLKNILINHVRALAPEPFIDRRGRLIGNWIGLAHLFRGRIDPMQVLQL